MIDVYDLYIALSRLVVYDRMMTEVWYTKCIVLYHGDVPYSIEIWNFKERRWARIL